MAHLLTSPPSEALAGIDWEDLLDTLEAEKCVLFLGSGAYAAPGGGPIEAALRQHLGADDPDNPNIRLRTEDGFLLFHKNRFKRRVIADIRAFYSQSFPEASALLQQIAALPCAMIFTTTPDNLLTRTFDELGFPYQSDFYFRHRQAPAAFERPTRAKPLIYNLLGNIEEPESLVLTQGDFFDYLESVFQGNSMNQELKEELERAERFIFLGLPYEKWYFPLLLRVLSMHSEKLREVERLALREFENPHLHTLYNAEFKLDFIPGEVPLFVAELYRQCREAGLLKQAPPPDPALAALPDLALREFQGLIAEARTDEALRHLRAMLDRSKPRSLPLLNTLIVLLNRYSLLRQRERSGTILPQDAGVENNQIVEQVLELAGQVSTL